MKVVAMIIAACALMSCASIPSASDPSVIAVSGGRVRGSGEDGVESWRGIPFAAPPVGPLRWRAPQPVQPWVGVRDATSFGADCVQLPLGSPSRPVNVRTTTSEDCLYINVWRPAGAHGKLPVVVWIYGGGWVFGGTSAPLYSGANLARQGVVVVSFNYRVGRFGFFAHPALTRENADGGLFYNYGTLDQIAALRWIEQNIESFGGDSDNVTLMGESAGGVSIHLLVTSPSVPEGLFDKAIIMSGADGGNLGTAGLRDGEGVGANFARSHGIEGDDAHALARLRALPTSEILGNLTFGVPPDDPPTFNGPIADGRVVAEVGQQYERGAFRRVPMMIGATADDMGGRHGFMVAGARRISRQLAATGLPIFAYRFSYVAPGSPIRSAVHGTDISFFMQNQRAMYGDQATSADDAMAATISRFVVEFARANPRTVSLSGWPRLDASGSQIMDFSIEGVAQYGGDPWATEIYAAPAPQYPGLRRGGAEPGAGRAPH